MAWSTRQLAELAATTIKSIRQYHKVGLLDEPERKMNGYKQYGVTHLLRLLKITRFSELGRPVAQIATLGLADDKADGAIVVLDTELEATIKRLQRERSELALILRHRAPPDLPVGFSEMAVDLSPVDRAMIMVFSRIANETTSSPQSETICSQTWNRISTRTREKATRLYRRRRPLLANPLRPHTTHPHHFRHVPPKVQLGTSHDHVD